MRLAVIRPSMFGEPASDALMPLFFAIARGLTPPEIAMDCYDERVEPLPRTILADAVLITVETFAARRAYGLADRLRAEGKTVLLGGFHPTMCPGESALHADAVLTGDAEDTLPAALADLAVGALKPRYDSRGEFDFSQTVYDYSVFTHPRYRLVGLVQFCRGCKFGCDFCSVRAFYPAGPRFRDVERVLADVRKLRQKYLFFVDDNLFSDPARFGPLLEGLRPLKKRWVCQISMDAGRDADLLRRMRAAGCRMVIMGFESLDGGNLRAMGKGANLPGEYGAVIENLRRAGIMLYGTFVVGYDGDTAGTAGRLRDFAAENGFAVANFNPLMPMPGTPLYQRLRDEGRLPWPEWWTDPDYAYGDAQVEPRGMTGEELTRSCREARFGFYRAGSILRRLRGANLWPLGNLFLYLAMNAVSGREIRFKQGRKLGGET